MLRVGHELDGLPELGHVVGAHRFEIRPRYVPFSDEPQRCEDRCQLGWDVYRYGAGSDWTATPLVGRERFTSHENITHSHIAMSSPSKA